MLKQCKVVMLPTNQKAPFGFNNGKIYTSKTSEMNSFKSKGYTIDNEQLARYAKAMGHPARITILQFLASMDSCYFGDIHNELPIAKATVSQHLKELKDSGLIQGEIETPKVKYCINRDNWEKAQKYFETFFSLKNEKTSCCN